MNRRKAAAIAVVLIVGGAYAAYRYRTRPLQCCVVDPRAKLLSRPVGAPAPGPAESGMAWIPGGEFLMGAEDPRRITHGGDDPMSDARPVHPVVVDGFWMDETEVTNAQFAKFVKATGYVTVAEKKPTREEFPTAPPGNLVAGSAVFTPTKRAVSLRDHFQWWKYVHGADWRHPLGSRSSIKGKDDYPVVQVAYEDAAAYAKWAGKRLPTEAEWEFAARGGLVQKPFVWGDEFMPGGKHMANTYQGRFPVTDEDTGGDGFKGLAPVKNYPANGYGLYDMAGNAWEWCSDWYRDDYYKTLASRGTVRNPQGPDEPLDPAEPAEKKRVQRGGSFLCTEQYCSRYLVGSRGKGEQRTSTDHVGFRCVRDPKPGMSDHGGLH